MNGIGEFIVRERKKQNLTQKELAKRMGVASSVLSHLENGSTQKLMPKTLERLSKGLNLNKEYIIRSVKKSEIENEISKSIYKSSISDDDIVFNSLSSTNKYRKLLYLLNSYISSEKKHWKFEHIENNIIIGNHKIKKYLYEYVVSFDLKMHVDQREYTNINGKYENAFNSIIIDFLKTDIDANNLLIVFDSNDSESSNAYYYLKENNINNIRFKIDLVLYSLENQIVDLTEIRNKKR